MERRTRITLLVVALVLCTIALFPRLAGARLAGNHQGFAPEQPIAYSHRLHAGELEIPCLYCHSGAEKSRHAGIPSAKVCMNCHKFVTAPFALMREEDALAEEEGRTPNAVVSAELKKLFDAIDTQTPIQWTQIHKLPDFAFIDHRRHVAAGVACQSCHGAIETMERVRQDAELTMGWCIDCHRRESVGGGLNCAGCHD